MPYKIHTKFHPSKPRPDRDLCDCHTSLGWPREGDAWPVEAGCDAGWLKGSPYGKGKRVCDGAVSDPRLLPWGWHTSPEMLHQWLWMGRGSSVGVWGVAETPVHAPSTPTRVIPGHVGATASLHPAMMHSHSGQPHAHAASPPGSSPLGPWGPPKGRPGSNVSQPHTQRQAACPGNGASMAVPAPLGGGPLCPHGGQAGEGPGQVCSGRGRTDSLRPDLWLPRRHSVCK